MPVLIGIAMANIFRPEAGLHLAGATKKVTVKVALPMVQVLLNIVPTNPFVGDRHVPRCVEVVIFRI